MSFFSIGDDDTYFIDDDTRVEVESIDAYKKRMRDSLEKHKYKLRVYSDPKNLDSFETIELEIVDDVRGLHVQFTNDEQMKKIWSPSFHGKCFHNMDDGCLYYLEIAEDGLSKWRRASHLERIYEKVIDGD
jgi:hypothetical protein